MVHLGVCERKNLCVDCDSEICGHAGVPEADCPLWVCKHPELECKDCDILKACGVMPAILKWLRSEYKEAKK